MPNCSNNGERLTAIKQLSREIEKTIIEAKSVTRDNKKDIAKWANQIEGLVREIAASLEHNDLLEKVQSSIESTLKSEIARISAPMLRKDGPPTYAQVASSGNTSPPKQTKPTSKPSLIIYPTSEDKNRQEVTEQWRKSVNFREVTYAPAGIKPVGRNRLRVEFDTTGQRDETLKRMQASSEIRAEPSRRLKPMIILKGVSKQTAPEELTQLIVRQNAEIEALQPLSDDLQFRFQRLNKNENLYNAVLLSTPRIWRKLVELGRINVDHQRVHVEEFVPLLQCFKCLQYGHLKKYCTGDSTPCSHCGTDGHTFATCPSKNDEAKCFNCNSKNQRLNTTSDTRHSATSSNCPVKDAMRSRVIAKIDYGA